MSTPDINSTIRAEMARSRVRQADLADALDLTQAAVSSRLNGRTDWRLAELRIVADVLDVPLGELLDPAAAVRTLTAP